MGWGATIKAWWQTLSGIKQVLSVLLFFFTLVPTVYGGVKGWGEVREWWNDRDKPAGEFDRTPHAGLEFWQDDELAPMLYRDDKEQVVRVALDPKPFLMRLPAVDDHTAVEVCAGTDETLLRLSPDPSTVISANRIPCMRPGRGAADEDYASGRLFLSDEGRNYFIGNRLRPFSNELDQAYFSRTSTIESGDKKLSEQRDPLYLLVYIDRNADRRIDRGEFEAVELTF